MIFMTKVYIVFVMFLFFTQTAFASFIYIGPESNPRIYKGILIEEMQESSELLDNGDLLTQIRLQISVTKKMSEQNNSYYILHFAPFEGYKRYMPPFGKNILLDYNTCSHVNNFYNCIANTTNMKLINVSDLEYVFNISVLPINESYPHAVFIRYQIENPLIQSTNFEKILSIGSKCSAFPDPQNCIIKKSVYIPTNRYVPMSIPKEGTLQLSLIAGLKQEKDNQTIPYEYKYWRLYFEDANETAAPVLILKDTLEEDQARRSEIFFTTITVPAIWMIIGAIIGLLLGAKYEDKLKKFLKRH